MTRPQNETIVVATVIILWGLFFAFQPELEELVVRVIVEVVR